MANKEASIKLTLNNQSFLSSVKGVGDEAEKSGSRIGKALDKGFEEGKKGVKELFSSVKSLIGLGAALGGAFSFKEGIEHALSMETKYKAIARQIKQVTGSAVELKQVQEDISSAGHESTVSIEKLSDAFLDLLKTTGNADFSTAAMHAAAQEATRTGKSFDSLSSLAGDVNKKFGISAEKIGETLRVITANTDIGGPKLDELANGFELMGAVAESGGLKGQAGLELMLGMLNKTAPVLGRFSESGRAMQGVFSALQAPEAFNKIKAMTAGQDGGKFMKKLIDAPDAIARLDLILQKGGAVRKEFERAITDRKEIALYKILTEPFDKSVAAAMASGKKGQDAIAAGAAGFERSLQGLTIAGDSKAAADKELATKMASSKAKLDQAMKELEEAFEQPEVIKAVKDLMGLMPPLVHALSKLVEFFAAHPTLGVAGVVGGVAAKGAVGSLVTTGAAAGAGALGGFAKTGAKGAWQWLKGLAGEGAAAEGAAATTAAEGGAVAAATEGGAVVAGTAAAAEGAAVVGGGAAAATGVGGTVAAGGAAAGGMAAALPAVALASVAVATYEGMRLSDQSKPEGGVWKAISTAFSRGGELGGTPMTPEQYDKQHAEYEAATAAAQAKANEKVQRTGEVHDILNRNAGKAADALERLARAAGGAPTSGNTGEGVSKGPGAPRGGGPGSGLDWNKYG